LKRAIFIMMTISGKILVCLLETKLNELMKNSEQRVVARLHVWLFVGHCNIQ